MLESNCTLHGHPKRSAASPALSFEELSKILAEEWERLPEEQKTPYRKKADEERLRHETMGAAMVLTQVYLLVRWT